MGFPNSVHILMHINVTSVGCTMVASRRLVPKAKCEDDGSESSTEEGSSCDCNSWTGMSPEE